MDFGFNSDDEQDETVGCDSDGNEAPRAGHWVYSMLKKALRRLRMIFGEWRKVLLLVRRSKMKEFCDKRVCFHR